MAPLGFGWLRVRQFCTAPDRKSIGDLGHIRGGGISRRLPAWLQDDFGDDVGFDQHGYTHPAVLLGRAFHDVLTLGDAYDGRCFVLPGLMIPNEL
jgi:hypothetical protein